MSLYSLVAALLAERLESSQTPVAIARRLCAIPGRGRIVLAPASHFSRKILDVLERQSPAFYASGRLVCLDASPTASSAGGVSVLTPDALRSLEEPVDRVIVASNTYPDRELVLLRAAGVEAAPRESYSFFHASLPGDGRAIVDRLRTVVDGLADDVSRSHYLLTWLSRLCEDEAMTCVFSDPAARAMAERGDAFGYDLQGLPPMLLYELAHDLYCVDNLAPNPGDVVLDLGAYRGDTAVRFADMVGETGVVHAFEPIPGNLRWLRRNIAANRFDSRVVVAETAVGGRTGRQRICSNDEGAPWSFFCEDDGCVEVAVTTVDDYCAAVGLDRVDFIKVDVEGAEMEVLSGTRRTLAAMKPALAVALYHKSSDFLDIPELLLSLGYTVSVRCKIDGPYAITCYATR